MGFDDVDHIIKGLMAWQVFDRISLIMHAKKQRRRFPKLNWWWRYYGQTYENEAQLGLGQHTLLTFGPWLRLGMSNVKHAYFMNITSTCIHLDQWKSFVKFGAKKSHEMISYNLDWIALLSKWENEMLTKPCYLAQMTLIELYNKSLEGFVLSRCQEKASIGQKP